MGLQKDLRKSREMLWGAYKDLSFHETKTLSNTW